MASQYKPHRWLAAFGVVLGASLLLSACSRGGGSGNGVTKRAPHGFYRMQADFIVKETGEPIRFDYVAACGGVVMSNAHTTPTAFITHHPQIMFAPVTGGKALGLATIDACDERVWDGEGTETRSRIPDDLRPLAIWFEDINDLSVGWGYKTDDAYESPLAKIEFVKASLTKSTYQQYHDWREKAASEYQQAGALPGPWGFNYTQEPISRIREVLSLGAGLGVASSYCFGTISLPADQKQIDAIFAAAPEGVGRFWLVDDANKYVPELVEELFNDSDAFGDGQSLRDFRYVENHAMGTITRAGGGHIVMSWNEPYGFAHRDVYPFLTRSASMPGVSTPQAEYLQKILRSDEYKGFGYCDTNSRPIDMLGREPPFARPLSGQQPMPFDPDERLKQHVVFVNDEAVFGEPGRQTIVEQSTPEILDRHGFVLLTDN